MAPEPGFGVFEPVTERTAGEPQIVAEFTTADLAGEDGMIWTDIARLNDDGTVEQILCDQTAPAVQADNEWGVIYDPEDVGSVDVPACTSVSVNFLPDGVGYVAETVPEAGQGYGIRVYEDDMNPPAWVPPGEENTQQSVSWTVGSTSVVGGGWSEEFTAGVMLLAGAGAGVGTEVVRRLL